MSPRVRVNQGVEILDQVGVESTMLMLDVLLSHFLFFSLLGFLSLLIFLLAISTLEPSREESDFLCFLLLCLLIIKLR